MSSSDAEEYFEAGPDEEFVSVTLSNILQDANSVNVPDLISLNPNSSKSLFDLRDLEEQLRSEAVTIILLTIFLNDFNLFQSCKAQYVFINLHALET